MKEDKSLLKVPEDDEEILPEKKKQKKKRVLNQKERIIYAPNTNLGFLNYEKSGGYINTVNCWHFVGI